MANQKGYLFTLDAILAFALLLGVAAVFLASQHTSQSSMIVLDAANQKTLDQAVVDNALGATVNGNLPAGTGTGVCNTQYYFEGSQVKQRKECEVVQ